MSGIAKRAHLALLPSRTGININLLLWKGTVQPNVLNELAGGFAAIHAPGKVAEELHSPLVHTFRAGVDALHKCRVGIVNPPVGMRGGRFARPFVGWWHGVKSS